MKQKNHTDMQQAPEKAIPNYSQLSPVKQTIIMLPYGFLSEFT